MGLEKIAKSEDGRHICPGLYQTHGRALIKGDLVIPLDGKRDKYYLPVKYCPSCLMAAEELKVSWTEDRFYFP